MCEIYRQFTVCVIQYVNVRNQESQKNEDEKMDAEK